MTVSATDPFSNFYGVALTHPGGGPLLWSPPHRSWLRRVGPLDWFQWGAEPVDGDEVIEGEVEVALALIEDFLGSEVCRRCRQTPRAETHYIATNVFGDPVMYCVQKPPLEVVGSRGRTGVMKHWGSPKGCTAVKSSVLYEKVPTLGGPAVHGGYVYGEPLIADEVLLRIWCSRCTTVATRGGEPFSTSPFGGGQRSGDITLLVRDLEFHI